MRARGFTVVELMVALSVLTVVLTAALGGEETQRHAIAHAFDDLEVHLAASSRLERVQDPAFRLQPGTHDVDLEIQNVRARETVTEVAAGLYEVTLVVRARDGTSLARLATRTVREVKP